MANQKNNLPLRPLLALLLIRASGALQLQAAAVAAPSLIKDLGLSYAEVGSVIGAFTLPGIFLTVLGGLLANKFGDRLVLRASMVLMIIGAVISGCSNGFTGIVVGRLVSGCGGVVMLMLVIKMTADRFAGPRLSTASSIVIISWPLGFAASLVLLGPISEQFGWRWVLGLSGVPVALAMVLTFLVGHAPPVNVSTLNKIESRITVRFIAASSGNWTLYNAAFAVMAGFLPVLLMDLGKAPALAAATASTVTWSFAIAIPFAGYLADRWIGRALAVWLGSVVTGVLLIALAPSGGVLWVLALLGIAFAIPPGAMTALVGDATPQPARTLVFGWYSAGSYLGVTVALWLAGVLRDTSGSANAPMLFAGALMLAIVPCFGWFRFELAEMHKEWSAQK
jgi:MFS family permease